MARPARADATEWARRGEQMDTCATCGRTLDDPDARFIVSTNRQVSYQGTILLTRYFPRTTEVCCSESCAQTSMDHWVPDAVTAVLAPEPATSADALPPPGFWTNIITKEDGGVPPPDTTRARRRRQKPQQKPQPGRRAH